MVEDLSEEIRKIPLLRAFLPFLAGLLLANYIYTGVYLVVSIYVVTLVLLVLIWKKKKISYKYSLRWVFGLFINFCLFISAILYTLELEIRPNSLQKDANIYGVVADVIEIPEERERSIKIILKARAGVTSDSPFVLREKLLAYLSKDSLSRNIQIGDRLILENKFNEITNNHNPFEFDYKAYLENQGIQFQAFIQQGQWQVIDSGKGNPVLVFAGKMRKKFLDLFMDHGIENEEFAVASALILGYKAALDEDIKRTYSSSGAMHVLAVSGLHVGIIYLVLNYLLIFLSKFNSGIIIRAGIIIVCLWFYAILTGLSPSVMRAATMFTFLVIGSSLKRPANIYNSLAASAFFLILIDPNIIWAVGFQLSYMAVIGIVYFQPRFYRMLYIKNKMIDKVWALTCVSFGAQIGTFPLALYYFNQFPNLFFITNLFVIPLATLILYSGILLFATSFFYPLAAIFAFVLKYLVWSLNTVVKVIEALPFSHSTGIFINSAQALTLYLFIVLLTLYVIRKQVLFLKGFMVSSLVFIGIWSYQLIEASVSHQVIIYHVNNRLAMNYLAYDKNLVIVSDNSPETKRQIEYHASGNWTRSRAPKPEYLIYSETDSLFHYGEVGGYRHFWNLNGVTLIIADKDLFAFQPPEKPFVTDYIIFSGREHTSPSRILRYFQPSKIVISSSVPFWLKSRYKEELTELGLDHYDVSMDGALVVRL
jgi:competence protein ComEC